MLQEVRNGHRMWEKVTVSYRGFHWNGLEGYWRTSSSRMVHVFPPLFGPTSLMIGRMLFQIHWSLEQQRNGSRKAKWKIWKSRKRECVTVDSWSYSRVGGPKILIQRNNWMSLMFFLLIAAMVNEYINENNNICDWSRNGGKKLDLEYNYLSQNMKS